MRRQAPANWTVLTSSSAQLYACSERTKTKAMNPRLDSWNVILWEVCPGPHVYSINATTTVCTHLWAHPHSQGALLYLYLGAHSYAGLVNSHHCQHQWGSTSEPDPHPTCAHTYIRLKVEYRLSVIILWLVVTSSFHQQLAPCSQKKNLSWRSAIISREMDSRFMPPNFVQGNALAQPGLHFTSRSTVVNCHNTWDWKVMSNALRITLVQLQIVKK